MNNIIRFIDNIFERWDENNRNYVRNHTFYPVLVGYNGQYFDRYEIELQFLELFKKYWGIVIFDFVKIAGKNDEFVQFQFRIFDPVMKNCDKKSLEHFAKKAAIAVLTSHLRSQNIFWPVDHMVAAHVDVDVLTILFARRPDGIDAIARLNRPRF